jgi:hypothetical protein
VFYITNYTGQKDTKYIEQKEIISKVKIRKENITNLKDVGNLFSMMNDSLIQS